MLDFKAMGEQVVATVRDYCARAIDPVIERVAKIEIALSELPVPVNGRDADPELVKAIVLEVAAEQIKAAVAEIPRPRDGEDGTSVDLVALAGDITAAAAKAVEAMPKPKDGQDVDPAVVEKMVRDAVDAIPRPADGKSVTLDDIAPVIAAEVQRAVGAIQPIKGEDGRDADPQAIDMAVAKQLDAALKALPAPAPGKDADPAVIRSMVAEAVSEIPPAVNGKDADADAIAADVLDRVTKALEAIPAPQNGKDADPALVAELVNAEVEFAVAQIPRPQDGKSIDAAEMAAEIVKAAAVIVQSMTPPVPPIDDIKAVVDTHLASIKAPESDELVSEFAAALIARFAAAEHAA